MPVDHPGHLNITFNLYEREAELVSIMLIGYAELEFELASCLGYAIGDLDAAIRLLYRMRSEGQRIEAADALLRPRFKAADLEPQYSTGLGALRWCKSARNQYAHAHWDDKDGRLFFFDLEAGAKTAEGGVTVQMKPIGVDLLRQQVKYFHHAASWLTFLSDEYRTRTGTLPSHDGKEPPKLKPPKLHSLQS